MSEFNPQSATLLIVDDEYINSRLLENTLQGFGDIHIVDNGYSAVERAKALLPDIILLDVNMPGIDGFETCSRLQAIPELADTAIIFITINTSSKLETRALESGAVDFITKPINPSVVRARVKTHLRLKQQAVLLRQQAFFDALTGIANRRQFDQSIEQEWRREHRSGNPLSLLIIDIDYFKQYNDNYSHLAGDECLINIATLLRHSARRAGDDAFRLGGDEFALLLPNADYLQAKSVGTSICTQVRSKTIPHRYSVDRGIVTVSVGGATCRVAELESPKELIAMADQALYQAKNRGRNCCCINDQTILQQDKFK